MRPCSNFTLWGICNNYKLEYFSSVKYYTSWNIHHLSINIIPAIEEKAPTAHARVIRLSFYPFWMKVSKYALKWWESLLWFAITLTNFLTIYSSTMVLLFCAGFSVLDCQYLRISLICWTNILKSIYGLLNISYTYVSMYGPW